MKKKVDVNAVKGIRGTVFRGVFVYRGARYGCLASALNELKLNIMLEHSYNRKWALLYLDSVCWHGLV